MQDGGTMYDFHSEVFEKVRIWYEAIDVVINSGIILTTLKWFFSGYARLKNLFKVNVVQLPALKRVYNNKI